VAENYFKASNAKGLSEDTRKFLTNKWALYREIAHLMAVQDPKTLESIVMDSQSWLTSAEQVAAEAAKIRFTVFGNDGKCLGEGKSEEEAYEKSCETLVTDGLTNDRVCARMVECIRGD